MELNQKNYHSNLTLFIKNIKKSDKASFYSYRLIFHFYEVHKNIELHK